MDSFSNLIAFNSSGTEDVTIDIPVEEGGGNGSSSYWITFVYLLGTGIDTRITLTLLAHSVKLLPIPLSSPIPITRHAHGIRTQNIAAPPTIFRMATYWILLLDLHRQNLQTSLQQEKEQDSGEASSFTRQRFLNRLQVALIMATTETAPPLPLERILPWIVSASSKAIGIANFFLELTLRFFSPLAITLYIFAPVTVLVGILQDVFLRWPYTAALYLLDAFYPIYVLVGVACIVGLFIGGVGRLVTILLVDLVTSKMHQASDMSSDVIESEVKKGKKRQVKVEDDD
ncbi:hypothetical protein H0H92_006623 [Tricholoma furcatifolium]|nr:hypothetical protein H0H92_006623 [Tricholoma furcatifolium]